MRPPNDTDGLIWTDIIRLGWTFPVERVMKGSICGHYANHRRASKEVTIPDSSVLCYHGNHADL